MKIEEELEVYKTALDWLAQRCATLDRMSNGSNGDVTFSASSWREWAIKTARRTSKEITK